MKIMFCGSMTASREMIALKNNLEKIGHQVILPEFTNQYATLDTWDDMHSESAANKEKYDLIRGYFNKMKDVDAILVVNVDRKNIAGYIGGNSFLEMGFAHVLNKKIFLLNPVPEMSYKDEIEVMKLAVLMGDITKIG